MRLRRFKAPNGTSPRLLSLVWQRSYFEKGHSWLQDIPRMSSIVFLLEWSAKVHEKLQIFLEHLTTVWRDDGYSWRKIYISIHMAKKTLSTVEFMTLVWFVQQTKYIHLSFQNNK